jgi:hypothetical protein
MKKVAMLGMALVLAATATGCGGSPDSLAKEELGIFNDISATLEGVKDDASADAAIPKLEKQADQLASVMKKIKELSPEQQKKITEKYQAEIQKTMARMMEAMMKAGSKAPSKVAKLGETFKKLGAVAK